ncbi:MAG: cytoplasmic protein [Paenibacillus sp.]|jgi:uncharacterized protein (DUF1697 family)|nr:cytoplasmic protein [Paenibacillus sp.]
MNSQYVALLRGINVGGHKKIKMVELKRMFEGLGFQGVQTYIQSGNVLFESKASAHILRQQIEKQIEEAFGFQVTVVLRTIEEMERIVRDCPYDVSALAEGENIYFALLVDEPSQEGKDRLLACNSEVDDFYFSRSEVYIYARKSIRESVFSNNLIENKVGMAATTRNWKTMNKLLELGRAAKSDQ